MLQITETNIVANVKETYSIKGKCLNNNIIYQATACIVEHIKERIYIGANENQWKNIYYNHMLSLENKKSEKISSFFSYY